MSVQWFAGKLGESRRYLAGLRLSMYVGLLTKLCKRRLLATQLYMCCRRFLRNTISSGEAATMTQKLLCALPCF